MLVGETKYIRYYNQSVLHVQATGHRVLSLVSTRNECIISLFQTLLCLKPANQKLVSKSPSPSRIPPRSDFLSSLFDPSERSFCPAAAVSIAVAVNRPRRSWASRGMLHCLTRATPSIRRAVFHYSTIPKFTLLILISACMQCGSVRPCVHLRENRGIIRDLLVKSSFRFPAVMWRQFWCAARNAVEEAGVRPVKLCLHVMLGLLGLLSLSQKIDSPYYNSVTGWHS